MRGLLIAPYPFLGFGATLTLQLLLAPLFPLKEHDFHENGE